MRASRIATPLPYGKGFSVPRAILVPAVLALALAFAPAHAANVTVTFGLSAGVHAATGTACPVSVPAGADGISVLDAAKAKGCIVSYHKQHYSGGDLVDCINEVCGAPPEAMYATYWSMYVDGKATIYGVNDFRAADGKDLAFVYTSWLPCAAHPSFC